LELNLVSKKETKKTKSEKIETPAVEPIIDSKIAKPSLDTNLVKAVVDELAPQINSKITASFEEIKNLVMGEIKKIQPQPVEEPVAMEQQIGQPDLSNIDPKEKSGLEALLPLLMPLLAPAPAQPAGQTGLTNMFMESMIRNSMANLTRNDGMQDLIMKHTYKKLLGEDPPANIVATTNELMNPLNNYGHKAQAAREKAKSNL
jgi:hypothetical protein